MKLTYLPINLTFLTTLLAVMPTLATPMSGKSAVIKSRQSTTVTNHPLPVTVIHDFGPGTWVENLAVRSNGQILATIATAPELYQVDPTMVNPPILVHTFVNATGLAGIVETTPDVFYVLAGSGSPFEPDPDTFSVWTVNLNSGFLKHHQDVPAVVSKVANIPNGILCNGMAVLSIDPPVLLIADSLAGVVWRLDVETGDVTIAVQNPDMTAFQNGPGSLGINGLKIRNGVLFWTDTDREIFASVPIHTNGTPAGTEAIVADGIAGDDFVFDSMGNAFIAQDPDNSVLFLGANGREVLLTNSTGSNVIAGPTACKFGRTPLDNGSLYVTSNGGFANYESRVFTVGGRVSRIDVAAAGFC